MRRVTLPNGLRVLIQEMRLAPVISVQAWMQVGSADEVGPEAGLSHMLEHMLFKGTPEGGVGSIARDVESCGGEINAYTSFDQTVLHLTVPSRHLDRGLDVARDAVVRPALDAGEFAMEKEVVLEEIRRGEDDPGQRLSKTVFAEAFEVHPYGRPVIGTTESVRAFTPELLRDFHRRWYCPRNTLLVVTGDASADEILRAVEQRFGDWPDTPVPARERTPEPVHDGLRARVLAEPVVEARIELSFPLPAVDHADIPVADVLAVILGQGESSRLNQEIRLRRRLANHVHAFSYTPKDPGALLVGAQAPPEAVVPLLGALAGELGRIARDGVAPEEVQRAAINILSDRVYEKETVQGVARKLGYFESLFGDTAAEAGYYAAVGTVSAEDVRRFAAETFALSRAVVAALVPADSDLTPEEVMDALRGGVGAGPIPADRAAGPATERRELPGGVRLLVRENPGSNLVALRMGTRGGLLAESVRTNGVHNLLARSWPRGTGRRSAVEVAEAMDEIAGRCTAFSGRNSFGLSSTFLASGLGRGLDLFREVLLEPAFEADEVARMQALTVEGIRSIPDNPISLAFLHFHRALYPGHPFRMPVMGTEASVRRLTPGSLRSAYRRGLRRPGSVVVAVGDFDGGRMTERLAEVLAALPPADERELVDPPLRPLRAVRRRAIEVDKEQAHLVVGFPGATVTDPDRHALEVLAAILAGQSGRLFLDLRDRQGLAYSVTAWSQEAVAPGFFAVYIGTERSKLDRARQGIHAHLRRLCDEPVDDEELQRAVRYLVGNFEIGLQRGGAVASRMLFDELYGLGHDAMERYADQLMALTAAELQRVAQQRLTLDRHVELTLVPKK